MKGVFPDAEMAELPSDVAVKAVFPLQVPDLGAERHLVVMALTTANPRINPLY